MRESRWRTSGFATIASELLLGGVGSLLSRLLGFASSVSSLGGSVRSGIGHSFGASNGSGVSLHGSGVSSSGSGVGTGLSGVGNHGFTGGGSGVSSLLGFNSGGVGIGSGVSSLLGVVGASSQSQAHGQCDQGLVHGHRDDSLSGVGQRTQLRVADIMTNP